MRNTIIKLLLTMFVLGLLLPVGVSAEGGMNSVFIPAASFHPTQGQCIYASSGHEIIAPPPSIGGCINFLATIEIPDGATIKKLTFYWKDNCPTYDAYLSLVKSNSDLTGYEIVSVGSNGNSNIPSSSYVETSHIVDTLHSGYFIAVQMASDGNVSVLGAEVEYTFETSLPLIRR